MSYAIDFKVKVEGLENKYVSVADCNANITWNLREMIIKSTGLEWKTKDNNGLCKDVIPCIANGLAELIKHPEEYKQCEAENGWGTIEDCKRFFTTIIKEWSDYCEDLYTRDLADVTYFWIE